MRISAFESHGMDIGSNNYSAFAPRRADSWEADEPAEGSDESASSVKEHPSATRADCCIRCIAIEYNKFYFTISLIVRTKKIVVLGCARTIVIKLIHGLLDVLFEPAGLGPRSICELSNARRRADVCQWRTPRKALRLER
jgi:hypothetical protein